MHTLLKPASALLVQAPPRSPAVDLDLQRHRCIVSSSWKQLEHVTIDRRSLVSGALATLVVVDPKQAKADGSIPAPLMLQSTLPPPKQRGWLAEDVRQNLHVVSQVGDLDATVKFYETHFGMQLLRSRDFGTFKNAFMGYGPEVEKGRVGHCVMELTSNKGVRSYRVGSGLQYFGIATGSLAEGQLIKDPSGYSFQGVTSTSGCFSEPFAEVALQVSNLDRSIKFYTEVLGMTLLRTKKKEGTTHAFVGYGLEQQSTVFELVGADQPITSVDRGDGYVQMAVSTKDVYKTAEQIKATGGPIAREPGPVPGIGTKVMATVDPDGWRFAFVDTNDFLQEFL